ncbi:MAG TPA: hypothetical protein VEK80_14580 [Kribbellaceae bacterium]|nr:hypothetical protein [Kribbellaceae bacterium]
MTADHAPSDETRKDLQAALGARRDLGPEYENEVLDAFVEKVDARIAERVDQVVAQRAAQSPAEAPRRGDAASTWVALVSLGSGIPITAIASENSGLAGVMVAWAGIGVVNVAHAISRGSGRR